LCWKAASNDDWAAQYLMHRDYDSGLISIERVLPDALYRFLADMGPEAKKSPGWSRVVDTPMELSVDRDRLN
jgi:hypothetical protein